MQSHSREKPAAGRPNRFAIVHFLSMLVLLGTILVACATERVRTSDQASPSPSASVEPRRTWSERNMDRP